MFYKKRPDILYRDYGSFGYITDNRNFSYKKLNNNNTYVGDKILSYSGNIFFSLLSEEPQDINDIIMELHKIYPETDEITIRSDAKSFYSGLKEDGFIFSEKTYAKCKEKKITSLESSSTKADVIAYNPQTSNISTADFFHTYFKGKPQLTSIHIAITSRCNERCIHCYIPHENKICDINADFFYNILEQCKQMNLLHLTISGGEPMLHKHFIDFLTKCRENNFSVNVLSNLTILDDKIIKEMKSNKLLGVQTSLYSMESSIHDSITNVKGSFEKTKGAILKLAENGIAVQISCPIIKQNKNGYQEIIKWASELGINVGDDFNIIAKYNHSTDNLNCRLSINEVKKLIREKFKESPDYLKKIKTEAENNTLINPDDYVCSVCNSSICISEKGDVYPCAGWDDYIIGNLRDTSLKEIWDKSEKVQYLRNLRRKEFPKCTSCPSKKFCTMCMVRNANESSTGDPLEMNAYFCKIANLLRMFASTNR